MKVKLQTKKCLRKRVVLQIRMSKQKRDRFKRVAKKEGFKMIDIIEYLIDGYLDQNEKEVNNGNSDDM